jgi:hypothetical protein
LNGRQLGLAYPKTNTNTNTKKGQEPRDLHQFGGLGAMLPLALGGTETSDPPALLGLVMPLYTIMQMNQDKIKPLHIWG